MFTKKETLLNLLGCLEIVLFMKQGIARFCSSKSAAIKSFMVPLILVPITLMVLVAKSPGYPALLLLSLHGVRIVVVTALFLMLVYAFSKQFDRKDGFFQFVTVHNWINIPVFLLLVPVMAQLFFGQGGWESVESYAIFITMFSYVLTGYIATHTLRIPWEMGGCIAVISMFMNQTALSMVEDIRDILV